MGGSDFQPLEIPANLSQALGELSKYTSALHGSANAATQLAASQDVLATKTKAVEGATQKSEVMMKHHQLAALAMVKQGRDNEAQLRKTAAAQLEAALAGKEATSSFRHQKGVMKELADIGDNLIGKTTGLAGVIRGAMNPAFLAAALAAFAIGKAIQEYKEHQALLTKAIQDSVAWVENYSKALDENAGKLLTFNDFQKQISSAGKELASLKMDEKIKLNDEALQKANKTYEKALGLYKMELHTGGLISLSREQNAKQLSMIETAMRTAKGEVISLTLENKALADAHAKGFKTVDEYTSSMAYWQEVAQKAGRVVEQLPPGVDALRIAQAKLNAEWRVGAVDAAEYKKRMDQLFAINDATNKAAEKKGSGGTSAATKKKQLLDQIAAFEIKAEQDSLLRVIKGIDKEQKELEKQARETIKNKKELAVQLAKIEGLGNAQRAAARKAQADADKKDSDAKKQAAFEEHQAQMIALKKLQADRVKFNDQTTKMIIMNKMKGAKRELAILKQEFEIEKRDLAAKLLSDEITWKQYQDRLLAMKKAHAAASIEIAKVEAAAKRDALIAGIGQVAGMMSQAFGKNKKLAIVATTIDTFQSAMAAYKSLAGIPYVGPILGALAAAAAIKMGMDNISKIKSQEADTAGLMGVGQAHDGIRFPRSGSYLMNVQAGEAIVSDQSMQGINQAISRINQGGKTGGKGGITYNFNAPMHANRQSIATSAREHGRILKRRNVRQQAA